MSLWMEQESIQQYSSSLVVKRSSGLQTSFLVNYDPSALSIFWILFSVQERQWRRNLSPSYYPWDVYCSIQYHFSMFRIPDLTSLLTYTASIFQRDSDQDRILLQKHIVGSSYSQGIPHSSKYKEKWHSPFGKDYDYKNWRTNTKRFFSMSLK